MAPPIDNVTTQGYDLQFGTNVLGKFMSGLAAFPLLNHTASL
jgi:hypothetical protein